MQKCNDVYWQQDTNYYHYILIIQINSLQFIAKIENNPNLLFDEFKKPFNSVLKYHNFLLYFIIIIIAIIIK